MNPLKTDNSKKTGDQKVFDVRTIPCSVKHAQIFQRWLALPIGDYFILLNDHDPIPLRYQFEAEFGSAVMWEYLERGPEDFRVKITKLPPSLQVPAKAKQAAADAKSFKSPVGERIWEIDVRGLEPPQPLAIILNSVESLPADTKLRAKTDRQPCHLFDEAKRRGFNYECGEQSDGSWLTTLSRA